MAYIPDLQVTIPEIRLNELSLCLPAASCVFHIQAGLIDCECRAKIIQFPLIMKPPWWDGALAAVSRSGSCAMRVKKVPAY